MNIWNQLSETNPKYTKNFKKGGGFSGTAINPTYGLKKLTEMFGPCGTGWGDEIVESRFDEGKWITDKDNKETRDREIIHTIILKLWYVVDDTRREVIGVGTTAFVSSNKYGAFTDEEYFKKTMTDALSNAAKKLGLSADIFMGLYDDSKYVADVTAKYNRPDFPKRSGVNKALAACETIEDWKKLYDGFIKKYNPYSMDEKSGHNNETWGELYIAHKNRINKVNPIDTTQGPEEIIEEFEAMVLSCSDHDTYLLIATFQDSNPCLSDQKYIDKLLELAKDFPE